MSARALLSLAPGFSPNSEAGLGSARAPRAVFRALAGNFGGARVLRTALNLTRARANREGAVGSTRDACAPRAMPRNLRLTLFLP